MANLAPTLTFTHSALTPVIGEPTNSSVKLLKKEIYTNAREIPSTRGGGAHGHLGLVMPAAEYLVLAAEAFTLPAHPGATPVHAAGATGSQITEGNRAYTALISELAVATTVATCLKNQLLQAVEHRYLAALEHDEFGFAEVNVAALLAHLQTTYGRITREDLEKNRASIQTIWHPDQDIENLWISLREIKRLSIAGNDELSDEAIMGLTFLMFEATGVFTVACDLWTRKAEADKTWDNFKTHFNTENIERKRKLTAQQAGFHGAHAVVTPAPDSAPPLAAIVPDPGTAAAATATAPSSAPAPVISNDGVRMFYCWTHGLGTNPNHTSATCQRRATGHQDDATVTNMQGGNNTIMTGRPRRLLQD